MNHPDAGILWHGEYADIRGQWEDSVSLLLHNHGFSKVYSPFVYTRDLHNTYKWFVGAVVPLVSARPKREDFKTEIAFLDDCHKYEDCKKYMYLGHKGLCHIVMMQSLVEDNNVLPLKFYEFSETYDNINNKLVNSPGLYLTVACKPEEMNDYAANIYAIIMQTSGKMNLTKHGIQADIAPDLQYRTSSGKKENVGLVVARSRYTTGEIHAST